MARYCFVSTVVISEVIFINPWTPKVIKYVPKKGEFAFLSHFVVNFVEMTYKLVSRSETVQIKWKIIKYDIFGFWPTRFSIPKKVRNCPNQVKNTWIFLILNKSQTWKVDIPLFLFKFDRQTTYNDLEMTARYYVTSWTIWLQKFWAMVEICSFKSEEVIDILAKHCHNLLKYK